MEKEETPTKEENTQKKERGEELDIQKAHVQRIVKATLPENIQIAKDSKEALAKGSKIFVLYLTACANDICKTSGKSTISPEHILKAVDELELPFALQLKECVEAFQLGKNSKKQEHDESEEREKKRAKLDIEIPKANIMPSPSES